VPLLPSHFNLFAGPGRLPFATAFIGSQHAAFSWQIMAFRGRWLPILNPQFSSLCYHTFISSVAPGQRRRQAVWLPGCLALVSFNESRLCLLWCQTSIAPGISGIAGIAKRGKFAFAVAVESFEVIIMADLSQFLNNVAWGYASRTFPLFQPLIKFPQTFAEEQ